MEAQAPIEQLLHPPKQACYSKRNRAGSWKLNMYMQRLATARRLAVPLQGARMRLGLAALVESSLFRVLYQFPAKSDHRA